MTPEQRNLHRLLLLSDLIETAKRNATMKRRTAAIKSVIDQIPAVHEANNAKFGLVRERFLPKREKVK